MSMRKKQMIAMVVGIVLLGLIILVFGNVLVRWDQDEYARKCKSYEGTWWDKEETFGLEIHRVSSSYLFCSITNQNCYRKLRLLMAYSVGGDTYEFSYRAERLAGSTYKILPGTEAKGTISLQEGAVEIHFPRLPDKGKILEYDGTLTQKTSLPEEKAFHLLDYMGTERQMPDGLSHYASFCYDDRGKIWRIHAMLAEKKEYYKTDLAGICMNSYLQECEEMLGELTGETKLSTGEYRRQYQNDTYLSTVITNPFGVITELDCQLLELPDTTRQGDFLMRGDILYRYTGDYSERKAIELPDRTKRIASHAFDAGEHGYYVSSSKRRQCSLAIPAGVTVEEDAFANCGSLAINLDGNWKEIPKGSFAHMVSLASITEKQNWVQVNLPVSLEKIHESAFSLQETGTSLEDYWEKCDSMNRMAVSIGIWEGELKNLTYIGDDALWGIEMDHIPSHLRYLGRNYTVNINQQYNLEIPEKIRVLREDNLYLRGEKESYAAIYLPWHIEEIEEGAIRGQPIYVMSFINEKGEQGNLKLDEYGWLMSRDGKVLYYNRNSDYFDLLSSKLDENDKRFRMDEVLNVRIPEGVEEIRSYASLAYSKIIFPASLKRLSIRPFLNGSWYEAVFLGDVPELYGDASDVFDDRGHVLLPGKIKVKNGQKKKMLKQLLAGRDDITEEQKHQLAGYITTF